MRPSERPAPPRPSARLALVAFPLILATTIAACRGPFRPLPTRPPLAMAPIPFDEPPEDLDETTRALLEQHNRLRSDRDLPPLAYSTTLSQAARSHVSGMIEMGKVRHKGADGASPADRIERAGYRYVSVGENVAAGQETVDEVMEGWMNSPGHRRNILGNFQELGLAHAEDDDGRLYWCAVFAVPLPRLDPDEAAGALLTLINQFRSENDLPDLAADDRLDAVSLDHARAMAEAGSLDPPGPSMAEQLRAAGVSYRRVARSVSSGAPTAEDVLRSLTEAGPRRKDLLGSFDRAGIGYASGEGGRPYWSILLVEGQGSSP